MRDTSFRGLALRLVGAIKMIIKMNLTNELRSAGLTIACVLSLAAMASATATTPITVSEANTDITAQLQNLITHQGDGTTGNQGEDIVLPAGDFDISAALVIPCTRPVVIEGAGKDLTRIRLKADLGSGAAMISGSSETWPVVIKNLTILGVGSAGTMGVAPCRTNGIHALSSWSVENVRVGLCYAGIVVDGNHQTISKCTLGSNYYGVYFIKPGDASQADQFFEDDDFTGATFAGVACDGYQCIEGNTFLRCHTGFEPYAFYREPGVTRPDWIVACEFINMQVEGVGNAQFWDDSGTSVITQNHFSECTSNGTYGFAIPGRSIGPMWNCGGISGNSFTLCFPPASMSASSITGNHWSLNTNAFQINASEFIAGSLAVSLGAKGIYGNKVDSGDASGTILVTSNAVKAGEPVEQSPGDPTGYGCEAYTGTGQPLLGIAATSATAGEPVVVIEKGTICMVPVDSTVTSQGWVMATPGAISRASSDTAQGIIGYSAYAPGNGTATIKINKI